MDRLVQRYQRIVIRLTEALPKWEEIPDFAQSALATELDEAVLTRDGIGHFPEVAEIDKQFEALSPLLLSLFDFEVIPFLVRCRVNHGQAR